MIAGLPVHWVNLKPPRSGRMPAGLLAHDHVYVQGFDGSQPQHPMRAGHVHWENVVAYARAHADSDQREHRCDQDMDPTIQTLMDISKTSVFNGEN